MQSEGQSTLTIRASKVSNLAILFILIENYGKFTSAIISDNDHVEYKQLIDRNDEIVKDTKTFADKLGKINPEMYYEMISISGLDIVLEKTIKE